MTISSEVIVVKFGGHAMSDSDGAFGEHLAVAKTAGAKVVVVHGGGPQINLALDSAGIKSDFLGGFRVTTPETFAIVERVLSDQVGPAVAETLSGSGVVALAISGRHSGTLFATRRRTLLDGQAAELGLVGDMKKVDTTAINTLLEKGITPVISPVANDLDGDGGLNVNADFAAAAITGGLHARELIIMTDVAGIYRNWPDLSSLISTISFSELEAMKSTFEDGMAPKVQACLDAISAGASAVRIIDGRQPQAFADALAHSGGTLVTS
jgi:acetylglutamate kinase